MKFLYKLLAVVILLVVAFVVGMISPGQWLTDRRDDINKFYNKHIRFSKAPIAENFSPDAFDVKIVYVKNTEGKLETYLVNSQKNEMLPVLEIEGTTQVGDANHRLRGIGEEGRNKLKSILESAKNGSTTTIDKLLDLLGE
jgi:hypothetical protein